MSRLLNGLIHTIPNHPDTITNVVPKSGCNKINPTGKAMINAYTPSNLHCPQPLSTAQPYARARKSTTASLANSEGCNENGPKSNQLAAPRVTWANTATIINKSTVIPYRYGEY